MMDETGCVSVMIGRGALGRPWVFDPAYDALDEDGRFAYETDVISRHLDLIEAYFSPVEAAIQAKKHLMHYSTGWPGAKLLRGELFDQRWMDGVREVFAMRLRPLRPVEGVPAAPARRR